MIYSLRHNGATNLERNIEEYKHLQAKGRTTNLGIISHKDVLF